ncbi:MAG: hypothetical protein AABY53_08995 [Bdellovibrionota bacterium]
MSACVLWIDSEHAKVFKISATGIVKKQLSHHSVNPIGSRHDQHKINAENNFFHEVALSIGLTEELLILGAGLAKNHFKNHLESHHHQELHKHIVGMEALDSVSDNQILEFSRKFFKKYNTYNSAI